jgi:hypothetical protein
VLWSVFAILTLIALIANAVIVAYKANVIDKAVKADTD